MLLRIRSGVSDKDISIGSLGYARKAIDSFQVFRRLKGDDVIPATVRFQVSIPTPVSVLFPFAAADKARLVGPCEQRLAIEVDEIAAAIPHEELAIQWDAANEFGFLGGIWTSPYGPDLKETRQQLHATLVRLGNAVPADVELGYHLCYGDAGHKHYREPTDLHDVVVIANALEAGLERPLNWIHFPVPQDRSDDAYFLPLQDLTVSDRTEIYAGLVHLSDGVSGAEQRIAALQRAFGGAHGIATECGLGRTDPAAIPNLLKLQCELCGPPESGL